jgi:hypothetical protein
MDDVSVEACPQILKKLLLTHSLLKYYMVFEKLQYSERAS